MPQLFTCPHCQAQTLVDDKFVGQSGSCFQCGQTIVIARGLRTTANGSEPVRRTSRWSMWMAVALVIVLGGFASCITYTLLDAAIMPAVQNWRLESASGDCAANLRRIGAALEKYHAEHGCYPPAYSVSKTGQPLLSWRVLILPYLGETNLYKRFNLDEPWNSPMNSLHVTQMPRVFGCPLRPDESKAGETSYMVLVGPNSAFQGSTGVTKSAITDDPSLTILVAETELVNVNWTAPIDIEITKISLDINGAKRNGIGSEHLMGAHALTADGKVLFLPEELDAESIRGLSTINGKEDVDSYLLSGSKQR